MERLSSGHFHHSLLGTVCSFSSSSPMLSLGCCCLRTADQPAFSYELGRVAEVTDQAASGKLYCIRLPSITLARTRTSSVPVHAGFALHFCPRLPREASTSLWSTSLAERLLL